MLEVVSAPSLVQSALQNPGILTLGTAVTAAALADRNWMELRGGAVQKKKKKLKKKVLTKKTPLLSPTARSALYMSIAMACHYLGYSLARPVTVALFTSSSTGFTHTAAFPLAMAFVSPVALLLLMAYNQVLQYGPQQALLLSTCACAAVLVAAAAAIYSLQGVTYGHSALPAAQFITGPLFVFREAYVQLLTSQYWSFLASVLTPNESATWFGPMAGLTSAASAMAGYSVTNIVSKTGLLGGLCGTAAALLLSLVAAHQAYRVAHQHGFAPAAPQRRNHSNEPIIPKARQLFQRVPVLKALFHEILASQGLATILNVIFVARLSTALPDDVQRAGWVGQFYASINVVTMVLQFLVLPLSMQRLEARVLWRIVPLVSLALSSLQSLKSDPSLWMVSASLFGMKVSEYSARRMLDEMVYVPLDFEARFVGKEVLGVFGYRFGKSIMSLLVSGITSVAGSRFGLQEMSYVSTTVALLWCRTAWKLSLLVPTRQQAQATHQKSNKQRRR